MHISVIIPTYNEEAFIASTIHEVLSRAYKPAHLEIIVADSSSDQTVQKALHAGARIVEVAQNRRSIQMNAGAKAATSKIFYFLHADTIPPLHFDRLITRCFKSSPETAAGCFRLSFDATNTLLTFYAWCTRFDIDAFRFGDQSLFVTQKIFTRMKGFREDLMLMEDQEIIKRIKHRKQFTLLPQKVITSARKYQQNGTIRLQIIFGLIFILYQAGVKQTTLYRLYRKYIR